MSVLSDYKSAPFDLFVNGPTYTSSYTGTSTPPGPGYLPTVVSYGGNNTYDTSYDSLCGVKFNTSDGRQVAMVRTSGTEIAVASIGSGLLVASPAEITAWEGLAMTVPTATPATAGTYQILVTNGGTKLNINEYQGGYLVTATNTGAGQTLQIASHQAAAASATFLVTLQDPIQVTLDATTTVSLIRNPYIGCIVAPSSYSGIPVGVSFYSIPAGTASTYNGTSGALTAQGQPSYAFVGTRGIWGVRADGTGTQTTGLPVAASTTTAGDVTVFTAAKAYVGNFASTPTSASYSAVDFKL